MGVVLRLPNIQTLGHPDHQPGDVDPGLPGRQGPTPIKPFVPPPPAPGVYGPKGYQGPKDTGSPGYYAPPPVVQPPPPPQQPTFRGGGGVVQQPPQAPGVYGVQGAQQVPQAPSQHYSQSTFTPPQAPGVYGVQTTQPRFSPVQSRVMGYINRLFSVQPISRTQPDFTQRGSFDRSSRPVVGLTGAPSPTTPFYAPQPGSVQRNVYNVLQDPSGQTVANLGASLVEGAGDVLGRIAGNPARVGGTNTVEVGEPEIGPDGTGFISYRFDTVNGTPSRNYYANMSEDDIGADGRLTPEAIEKYEQEVADNVGWSILNRGEWPTAMTEDTRLRNGWSAAEMTQAGYFYNEDTEVWEYGQPIGDAPQTTGAAMPYGGYGYGGYPKYSYPRGGGGTYSPYQGYADYTEPSSRGYQPQQIQNRPARFGMVSWRI